MAHEFSGSAVIDRLINDVFEFLADGTNDPKFSPRVQQIRQTTDGPIGVGTVFESTVKDAGMTTHRQFELTQFEAPTKIRWTERSKNAVTVPDGGYDLAQVSDSETKVTIHNVLEGHGIGKLLVGFAARAAIKDAPAFAQRIKAAVEAATPAADNGPSVGHAVDTSAPPRPADTQSPPPAGDTSAAPAEPRGASTADAPPASDATSDPPSASGGAPSEPPSASGGAPSEPSPASGGAPSEPTSAEAPGEPPPADAQADPSTDQ
jgi:hypothetical protein